MPSIASALTIFQDQEPTGALSDRHIPDTIRLLLTATAIEFSMHPTRFGVQFDCPNLKLDIPAGIPPAGIDMGPIEHQRFAYLHLLWDYSTEDPRLEANNLHKFNLIHPQFSDETAFS